MENMNILWFLLLKAECLCIYFIPLNNFTCKQDHNNYFMFLYLNNGFLFYITTDLLTY